MDAIWPVVLLVLVSQVSPRDIHVDINQIVESGPASVNVEINQNIVKGEAGDNALLGKAEPDGDIWVVLVAGSRGWKNYRHQSDICHAYQILKENGIPNDHIVVMMYDDIADNINNTRPGEIINRPDGLDVYKGVPRDYTGPDVTVENFFNVLSGYAGALKGIGSGKVIHSGPNDRIFINFDGHGDRGIFVFPNEKLMANEFQKFVYDMHTHSLFKEMVVYMESCKSGSMFQDMSPNSIGFYALSASSPTQPAYATYWSPSLKTYLGTLFAISWMDDVESNDPKTETLKENFDRTKELTNRSTVMQWGQISIEDEFVSAFMGSRSMKKSSPVKNFSTEVHTASSVSCQDVPLFILQNLVKAAKDMEEAAHWNQEIVDLNERRSFVNSTMIGIAMAVAGDEKLVEELMEVKQDKITNWDCYGDAVDAFHTHCFNLGQSTYALTGVSTLLNLCEAGYDTKAIVNATKNTCTFPTMYNVV